MRRSIFWKKEKEYIKNVHNSTEKLEKSKWWKHDLTWIEQFGAEIYNNRENSVKMENVER